MTFEQGAPRFQVKAGRTVMGSGDDLAGLLPLAARQVRQGKAVTIHDAKRGVWLDAAPHVGPGAQPITDADWEGWPDGKPRRGRGRPVGVRFVQKKVQLRPDQLAALKMITDNESALVRQLVDDHLAKMVRDHQKGRDNLPADWVDAMKASLAIAGQRVR